MGLNPLPQKANRVLERVHTARIGDNKGGEYMSFTRTHTKVDAPVNQEGLGEDLSFALIPNECAKACQVRHGVIQNAAR